METEVVFKMSLPVGIQLFSLRERMEKDPRSTLRMLAEIGYEGVETYSGAGSLDAEEYRKLCDSLGLKIISAHVSYGMMSNHTAEQLRLYKKLGAEYIAYPYMDDDSVRPGGEKYGEVVKNMRRIAIDAKASGIQMLYHNHDFEFEKLDGQYKLDYQYGLFSPDELQAELDVCWIKHVGEDPVEYIKKYSGRCPCLHMKDFVEKNDGSGAVEMRPVGYGCQDVPTILKTATDCGVKWIIVEQDHSSMGLSDIECADKSLRYLRSFKW